MSRLLVPALLFFVSATACNSSSDAKDSEAPIGLDVLGNETNDVSQVTITVIGTDDDRLNVPRDLEFNPEVEGELWVVNQADDSVTIFSDAGTGDQTSQHIIDPYAFHFMEEVSSISFGAPGTFGTCQESRNTYNGQGQPNDFMGPTLWSSDLDIFGESNREAVDYLTGLYGFYTDLGSHLDMQHETPMCTGIVWARDNVYWAINGMADSIDRVDFGEDHGPGFDDHSDGITERFAAGTLDPERGVHTGMVLDRDADMLYFVDAGNNRVKKLDTTTGVQGQRLQVSEPGTQLHLMEEFEVSNYVRGDNFDGMELPSGLARVDDTFFVTDNETSTIFAFNLDGDLLDQLTLDLPEGSLMGIRAVAIDDLWVVDAVGNQVLRIQP